MKRLRKQLGLSLFETAQQLGISPRSIARWEAGRRPIPEGPEKLFLLLNRRKIPRN